MTVRPSGSESEAIFSLLPILWPLLLSKATLLFNYDFDFGYQCIKCGSICVSNSLDIKLFLLLL
jgi:hypothetical protein